MSDNAPSSGSGKVGGDRREKDAFSDLVHIEQVNKRVNKDFGLFESYQINPYTKKTLDFVTSKITERPSKINPKCVKGYQGICNSLWSYHATPMERYSEPQTEAHRYGWFEKGQGYFDRENYDPRFTFTHRTADFIKTAAAIKEFDKIMAMYVPKASDREVK